MNSYKFIFYEELDNPKCLNVLMAKFINIAIISIKFYSINPYSYLLDTKVKAK